MALSGDIAFWQKALRKAKERLQPLAARMDYDLGLADTMTPFSMPAEEGAHWDSYTANVGKTATVTTIRVIAGGDMSISIPGEYKVQKENKEVGETEQALGALFSLNDENLCARPETLDLKSGIASMAVHRGWVAVRATVYVDGKGKDEKVVAEATYWDPRDVLWWPSNDGMAWIGYRSMTTPEDIEQEYGVTVQAGDNDLVEKLDLWDGEANGVLYMGPYLSGGNRVTEWLKPPEPHHIGHRPVFLQPAGNMPLMGGPGDNLVNVGEGLLSPYRLLIPLLSRIMTYRLTFLGKAANTPMTAEYDGTGGNQPPHFSEDPNEKGIVTWLDTSKGERLLPPVIAQSPADAALFDQALRADLALTDLSAVLSGNFQGSPTGVAIQQRIEAALKSINPFLSLTEKALTWVANEWIGQFNALDKKFGIHLEGQDSKSVAYSLDRKPGEMYEKTKAKIKIKPNVTQDLMSKVTLAKLALEAGFISRDTAASKSGMVQDPQAEREKIDMEDAYTFGFVKMKRDAEALHKYGQHEDALMIEEEIDRLRQVRFQQLSQPQQPGQGQPTGGQPGGAPVTPLGNQPQAQIGQVQDQPNVLMRALSKLRGK